MKTEHGAGETPCILNGFWKTEFLIRIVFARVVTPSFNQEFMLIVVSFIFFLMALIFETGIIEFLKLYYYKKYKEELNII